MNSIRRCVEQQLNEIELIRCCYSSNDEFFLDDAEAMTDAKDFVDGKIENPNRNLSFVLKVRLNEKKREVEFQFVYPLFYPSTPVEVRLRTYFSRESDEKIREAVKKFLETKFNADEAYLMEFLSWIQDQSDLFVENNSSNEKLPTERENSTIFVRLWIYSHHIFSTEKRRNIIGWARESNLRGFSLPGKPGIVCVEGNQSDVEFYWSRLRSLNWKKLQVKEKTFLEPVDGKIPFRFDRFDELTFVDEQTSKPNFGELFNFLKEKQLENIFQIYFAFDSNEKK